MPGTSPVTEMAAQATKVKDVKTAFLQALPATRVKPLACRLPKDECPEGLDPHQLLLLLTEIYGLVTGPSCWRRSLLKTATWKLNYEVNNYDRCILTLPAEDSKRGSPGALTEGFIVIAIDDISEAGGPRHQEQMKQLESMFRFGKFAISRRYKLCRPPPTPARRVQF